jgi:uncharacterized protein YajQ (UPF0234 family)
MVYVHDDRSANEMRAGNAEQITWRLRSQEASKKIVQFLKDKKLRKVQANIQGDQLRVTSASKDDLQESMALLRSQDFGCELRFGNYCS